MEVIPDCLLWDKSLFKLFHKLEVGLFFFGCRSFLIVSPDMSHGIENGAALWLLLIFCSFVIFRGRASTIPLFFEAEEEALLA